jgi:2-polyprenyl-6-methoxyphenol hydroxylase-like FAD-dependent oxidoreductase
MRKSNPVGPPAAQPNTARSCRRPLAWVGRSLPMSVHSSPPISFAMICAARRYAHHELARFKLPSASEATERIKHLSGSWSAAELPHRVSQKFVEQVLRRHAEALPSISINYGWRLVRFSQNEFGVTADVERVHDGVMHSIKAAHLVGADGPRSTVRQALGYGYSGEEGVIRDFFGGRMYAIYLRAPDFYKIVPHPPAWMRTRDKRPGHILAPTAKPSSTFRGLPSVLATISHRSSSAMAQRLRRTRPMSMSRQHAPAAVRPIFG